MKIRKLLLLGGLVAVLSGLGCGRKATNNKNYHFAPLIQVLSEKETYKGKPINTEGIPRSAACTSSQNEYEFAMTISDNDKRHLLCYTKNRTSFFDSRYSKAKALIESEINDGDEEQVTVRGIIDEEGILELNSISANGYAINFAD